MRTFKTDNATLVKAAQMIKEGNATLAQAKKQVDAGKAMIADWLETERNCQLASLPIGEMINVDGVCLIEIGKQNRLDQATLQAEVPEIFTKYQREFPVVKYKPLV